MKVCELARVGVGLAVRTGQCGEEFFGVGTGALPWVILAPSAASTAGMAPGAALEDR